MSEEKLKRLALKALEGVGDVSLGEWLEWSGYAYHVRRRCSPEEAEIAGGLCDIRGTPEAVKRFEAIRHVLPPQAIDFALEEVGLKSFERP